MEKLEKRSESRRRHKKAKKHALAIVNHVLFAIEMLLIAYVAFFVISNGIFLNNLYMYAGVAVLVVFIALQLFFNITNRFLKTTFFLELISIAVFAFAGTKVQQVSNLFSKYTQNESVQEYTMSIIALKESGLTDVTQLSGESILAPLALDKENIEGLVQDVKDNKNITLNIEDVTNYAEAYQQLKDKKVKAIVLSSAYESLLASEDENFENTIVKIYEYKIVKKVEPEKKAEEVTGDSFNVYISGIDTYGPITGVSRSDVNIIATVNTKTKNILLTTTPRDSYVRIADGGGNQYDKLTHAGIYGVNASIHTLENLYDISLDYYGRVNFTTFMNLIDVVGGVDVYNAYAFDSYTIPGKVYPAGNIHLDAEAALGYVRERYNLVNGDVGRAAHQEQVITQVIKKLLSSRILTDSSTILSELSESTQTNMQLNTIFGIVNKFMETPGDFKIQSQALSVTGQMGLPSYAMPGATLYMGVINEESLSQVKQNIADVAAGKSIEVGVTENPGE